MFCGPAPASFATRYGNGSALKYAALPSMSSQRSTKDTANCPGVVSARAASSTSSPRGRRMRAACSENTAAPGVTKRTDTFRSGRDPPFTTRARMTPCVPTTNSRTVD